LSETVARYNDNVKRGLPDEFGRTAMSNQFGSLMALDKPPFYAYSSVNVMLGTYCGISIDANMQVHDVFDEPIAGLYAAGEVVGGFHGAAYMTGTGLGKAAIFGRLAAVNALGTSLS
jgi:fumarate reductase flavoprotein subunit